MARQNTSDFQDIIQAAVDGLVKRLAAHIAEAAAELAKRKGSTLKAASARGRGRDAVRQRRPAAEMTAWTTDRRARRVPNFVIDMTGLDTKKKLVAKFGENVTFRRGQPLPPARQASSPVPAKPPRTPETGVAKPPVVAKPPRIRKASGA